MSSQKYNKLKDKHVLIIGGTSGIGLAVAEASLSSGAVVTVSSSSQARVDSTTSTLRASYPTSTISGQVCDLSRPSLEKDIEALFSEVGTVDHIVYTAADKLAQIPIDEITLESIHQAGHLRFFAPILVTKIGRKYLSPGPSSSITLTTGSVSERPLPNWSVVAGYAAGLHGLTRNLALDLAPLRVNCVSPGAVKTKLWDDMPLERREEMFNGIAKKLPTGRVPGPEDVAEAYLWLMKDWNVTGTVARSDGGALLV